MLPAICQETGDTLIYVPSDTLKKLSDTVKTQSDIDAIIEYSATDSAIFDISGDQLLLYNEADLKYKEYELKAARIILYRGSSIMEAQGIPDSVKSGKYMGTPIFFEGTKRYDAFKLRYNFTTRKGNIEMGSTEIEGGFYLGEKIKKVDDDIYFIKNGSYTTCDKAEPDYYFGSPKMKVIQGDKVVAEPVYLFIDDVPIFAIPFGIFPNHSGRSSGLIPPAYGEDPTYGRYLSHLAENGQPLGRDDAEVEAGHQHQEQRDRQPDAPSQRLGRAFPPPLVLEQEHQRGEQAGHNERQHDDDDDLEQHRNIREVTESGLYWMHP